MFLRIPHNSETQPQGKQNAGTESWSFMNEEKRFQSPFPKLSGRSERAGTDLHKPLAQRPTQCLTPDTASLFCFLTECQFRPDLKVSHGFLFTLQSDYESQVYKVLLLLQPILGVIQKNPKRSLIPSV